MLNLFPTDISTANLETLISQLTPEQAQQVRSVIIDALLTEKSFNLNNPFFTALREDKAGNFDILKKELFSQIKKLDDNHPAKNLSI